MEGAPIIRAESDERKGEIVPDAHAEAVAFVEKHRDLFEHYARGALKIESAPEGLDTFAFNLEKNTIYVNSRFYKKLGFSDEKTSFATLHEIEHFLEKKQILSEAGGERAFERYMKRIKESQAYGLMDNCVADIRENKSVVSKTSKEFGEIESDLHKEDLFKETDFTKDPKHVQFTQALLRESRITDEKCAVAPEVREKLDALSSMEVGEGRKMDIIEVMTNPEVPMSLRLKLQDAYVWPMVKELLEEDMKDEKEKRDKEGEGEGKGRDEQGETGKKKGGEAESGSQESKKIGKGRKEGDKRGGKPRKGGKGEAGKGEKLDPDEIFKEAYERANKKVPNAVPFKEIEKAFKEWQKANKESPLEKADKEYAEKLGVRKEDLQRYRNIVKKLEETRNPETGVGVVEELRDLIRRIIAKRLKKAPAPRYPVEEGEELVDPAELVAQARAGNLEPKVWETFEVKEKKGQRFGEVEITFIFDRSTSMDDNGGAKKREQLKAGVMGMEAVKEFGDLADEERVNLEKPLEVRSEVYSFQSSSEDGKPIKKMSRELSEKERIEVASKLSSTSGSTTDFVPLETIADRLKNNPELQRKINEGEVKKIVVIFTDGGSDDKGRVKKALDTLIEYGVVVACVAITEDAKEALETYKPHARLAETAEKLPLVLADLLKEHLANV